MKQKKSAYSDNTQKNYVLKFPEKVRGRRTTYYKIHLEVLLIVESRSFLIKVFILLLSALFVTTYAFEVDERS